MKSSDHERIRAYVDGELSPEGVAELLREARGDARLERELQGQLALRRMLSGLADPVLPAALRAEKPRARWLELLFGWRQVRLSMPAAATAGLVLFGAGAMLGKARAPAPAPLAQKAEPELVPVRFVFMGGEAKSVAVAGSFNGWSPQATPLHPVGDGIWEATVPLPRGEHRYIFQVDGAWQADPLANQLVPDGMGNMDAVIQL